MRFVTVFVLVSEGTMNSSVVCNHLRALQFFLESLKSEFDPDACQFTAFPCPAGWSVFQRGGCFPTNCTGKPQSLISYIPFPVH